MKPPKICPYCNHEVVLTSNKELYGREYGNGRCYLCRKCKASVGVHSGKKGKTPLGILATHEMKVLKKCCHDLFDPIWKSKRISRINLYRSLATRLEIEIKDCHFGHFETTRLLQAIELMSKPNWWKAGD
ncbi:zinc-finger-containing protein [Oceanobacillus profundus]|uniref:zinc-finger-containing protein n=1 Tax=Oceanobacillus TaxID=182709 RepID=UPI0026E26850|nr:zinc-finger-containing protein [Oceanobacillus profundus]MDO6448113.1 zinc-finger-containing protein [Oceanobacillus profundus]